MPSQLLSHVWHFATPWALPGSPLQGISQARTLEWVAISFSRGLADSGIEPASPTSPALTGRFFTTEPPGSQWSPQWCKWYQNIFTWVKGNSLTRYSVNDSSVLIPKISSWQSPKHHLVTLIAKLVHLKSQRKILIQVMGREKRLSQKGIRLIH